MRLHHGRVFAWTLVLIALVAITGIAAAVVAPDRQADFEIPLKQFDLFGYTSPAVDLGRAEAARTFSSAQGGTWKVYSWNPQTGTPSYLYGSGVQVAASLATEEDVVAVARGVIQANPSIFKAGLADLRVESTPHALGKWAVHFQQTYHGLDVWGGKVRLTFTDSGRLFVLGSDYYSNITVDSNPSMPASVAKEIARRDLPFREGADRVEDGADLLILPVPVSETSVDPRLVWRVRVRTEDPVGIWVTHVDAHSGEIVWRYNDVCFADFTGDATSMDQRPSYCEGQTLEAAPYLRIQIAGLTSVYADVNGDWTVPYTGSDSKALTADLYSPYVDMDNLGGAEGTFTGTATPGVPLTVAFTDLNSQRDEKDVYRAVNDIHTFFLDFAPTFGYINGRIIAHVRRPGTCNAYWDGSINFYAQGGGCANTGEIMGVVHHEYGHGIQNAILGSQGNQGLGEGNGDIVSNLMTMESMIGRGFYLNQCTSGIRDSENNLRYPGDVIGQEIHYAGQVIAGFHWDSMEELIADFGVAQGRLMTATTWHFGRVLQHPTDQPAQVLATFIADDDDGDLTNGTPHYDAYCVGATNHGFSCPEILVGVFINHEPLASRTEEGDVTARAIITSTVGPLVGDSLRLNYRINGGAFVHVRLQPTGQPDEFSGVIPGLVHGNVVEYYLRARDVAGNTKNAPESGLYTFDIATIIDHFDPPTAWTVNPDGDDTATSGLWIQADPVGTMYGGLVIQPEDDHTPAPGTICWVTGNGSIGGAAGEQDVDGGKTTLQSTLYDLAGSESAVVKYWLSYSDDLGINPGDDTWVVQVRNNGGAWVDVERTTESPNRWVLRSFDLYAAFGVDLGNVQFRFIANDSGQNSLLEALIDDFELLTTISTSVPGDAAGPARFALIGSEPNPARQGATIRFQVPATSSVRLSIYDVSGRQVKVLTDRAYEAGLHTVTWDGSDAQGHAAASGVYYYKMQSGGYNATRTLVLTR